MNGIYEEAKRRFIILKGECKYEKLLNTVKSSNAMTKVIRLSINERIVPTLTDLKSATCTIPYIFFSFDDAVNAMSALMFLKIWNEEVNEKYCLCPDYLVTNMAVRIKEQSTHLK